MDGNIQWVVNEETSHAKYSYVDGNISKCLKNVDKKSNGFDRISFKFKVNLICNLFSLKSRVTISYSEKTESISSVPIVIMKINCMN